MLTLAAMHVLNDTSDPFFTHLQAGAFAAKKPKGNPCDAVFHCRSGLAALSTGAKVGVGIAFSFAVSMTFTVGKCLCGIGCACDCCQA
jgi:endoglucanase